MISRRKTRVVNLGGVKIGYGHPVSIQSMTKVPTHDVKTCVGQINRLKKAGCDIVRIAVKDANDIEAINKIHKQIDLPIEADIHFNWQFAVRILENGIDGIRLNPGNIYKLGHIKPIVVLAKKKRVPIRVGLNSGSLRVKGQGSRARGQAGQMVAGALDYIKILEKLDFYDIMISLKSSDVQETFDAYRLIAKWCDYPLHLGITAAGSGELAVIKSSIGIGALLLEGIGDTIRVSLTDDPVAEVVVAKEILGAIGLRKETIEVISCPTCGRCQVDLQKVLKGLKVRLSTINYQLSTQPLKVAVMGCEVNGPGEASAADLGIACGSHSAVLFKKGNIVKKIAEKDIVKVMIDEIKNIKS